MYCKTEVIFTLYRIAFCASLRSRPKKEWARERETREGSRVSHSRALALSCAHYFQAPKAIRADTKSYLAQCEHLSDMWHSTLEMGAACLRSVTEIAPKSPFLFVNKSLMRYGPSCRRKSYPGYSVKTAWIKKMISKPIYQTWNAALCLQTNSRRGIVRKNTKHSFKTEARTNDVGEKPWRNNFNSFVIELRAPSQ